MEGSGGDGGEETVGQTGLLVDDLVGVELDPADRRPALLQGHIGQTQ